MPYYYTHSAKLTEQIICHVTSRSTTCARAWRIAHNAGKAAVSALRRERNILSLRRWQIAAEAIKIFLTDYKSLTKRRNQKKSEEITFRKG